ncbi:MAG: tRNA3(Ser)-specific nuclease WapA precursor [Firmicutes bacterium ADurb.Bin182]|nr:MAG: tRNA3(Ser)-specific nuclease WapA precursor [Firmicutes bacterium ADurb.Bin182]
MVTYSYDAWGKLLDVSGTKAATLGQDNPFRYRGYYYDTETGLYYLQSRYYNPEWCRFINADVYVSTGQGLLASNMFAYCANNPVLLKDPSGFAYVIGDDEHGRPILYFPPKSSPSKTNSERVIDTVKNSSTYKKNSSDISTIVQRSGGTIIDDSRIEINNIRTSFVSDKIAYNTYIKNCIAETGNINRGKSILAAALGMVPGMGEVATVIDYVTGFDTEINGDYYDTLGGNYVFADVTYIVDFDFRGIGEGKKITYYGSVVVGPSIDNPLNSVSWYGWKD